jgi:phosphatidate cytidylyltransferase
MLFTRILTAAALLAVLLPALWSPSPWPFALVMLLMVSVAAWEWARLNAASSLNAISLALMLVLVCAFSWSHVDELARICRPYSWVVMVFWLFGGAWALYGGPNAWKNLSPVVRWLVGLSLLWAAWLAFVQAKALGLNFVVSLFCLMWVADIAAYAGGRFCGRRKLAPSISPGKTWEGVLSALVAVQVLAPIWSQVLDRHWPVDSPSVYALLQARWGLWGACLAVLGLTAMGVVGDLLESLVKRSAGSKDSSSLLPGHGGVLDRVDSLLPVFPMALALVTR